MGAFRRGSKNAFRNSVRTVGITIILALSIALALVMLMSVSAVNSRIDQVKSDIGTTITVRSAGFRGFQGGGNPLTQADVDKIDKTPHVVSAVATLDDRLRNESSPGGFGPGGESSTAVTNLTSPIQPGTLGRRFGDDQAGAGTSTPAQATGFTLPVTVTGTTDPSNPRVLQVSSLTLDSGTSFDGTSTDKVALVGRDLASTNSLQVGSTFTAYGQTITVAGIYSTGDTFADAAMLMPLATLEELSGQTGVTTVLVRVDSVDNVATTTSALQTRLGETADVVSDATTSSDTLASLDNVKTIATYSLVGALVAGAAIIFLSMLMIVRERRREIGVLKAIGGSNAKISLQFVAEAITFTLMAAVAGIVIGIILSNPVLDVMVNNSTSSSTQASGTFPGGANGPPGAATQSGGNGTTRPTPPRGGGQGNGTGRIAFGQGFGRGVTNFGSTVGNLSTTVGVGTLVFGILAAFSIAILGSAIPAFFIAKVRPAEVMRSE